MNIIELAMHTGETQWRGSKSDNYLVYVKFTSEQLERFAASVRAPLQAKIDRLMLEYCPDEMTDEQVAEWGKNQKPVNQEPVCIDWDTKTDEPIMGYAAPVDAKANAKERYDNIMAECEEPDPIERLRFFCSLAMTGKNWIDVEEFFDDLIAERKAIRADEREKVMNEPLTKEMWERFRSEVRAEALKESARFAYYVRKEALEEAAKVCEKAMIQMNYSEAPYKQCAAAIRGLK